MRLVKFDTDTYLRTKDLSGGPLYGIVEEDISEIQIVTDKSGNPTRGGVIGYALAYILMAGFVGALFIFL
ncbi:hypothetical protein [Sphingobium sp. D43FB]|uniref:hypothetical protein n=1 Tax=Sphingobium sp. D43FB TaxID=2017595 RepID=UPI000BB54F1A|nr:hypothetical protein [Sphingobium sp. D43FB]PBN42977.1 hypothetical protein SxD43FB_13650 [Sphingobium sp. D43FB]